MKKKIKILFSVLFSLFIIINFLFIFTKLVLKEDLPKLFGYSQAIVLSDSMYPVFKKGDLVIFKESKYQKSDIIIFNQDGIYITHRIVEKENEGYITKGDNNQSKDAEIVPFENVEGKLVLVVPYLGVVLNFLTSIYGILVLALILIVSTYFRNKKILLLYLIFPISGTFALFETYLTGSDYAKVANVNMQLMLQENIDLSNMIPGEIKEIVFSVVNYENDFISEIKQEYEIIIKKTGNLLIDVNLSILNPKENCVYADKLKTDDLMYIFGNGVLNTEKEIHNYVLEIEVVQNSKNKNYSKEIDVITLEVKSIQKNS